jgi:hypothetical protein
MTKNAEFDAVSDGQILRVRVDYDGDMTILSPVVDLEYEIAYAAMGGRKSPELLFTEEWEETPIKVFLGKMSHSAILTRQRHLIALDWAEHVMPIYVASFPDKQEQVADIIKRARNRFTHERECTSYTDEGVKDQKSIKALDNNASEWSRENNEYTAWFAISSLRSLLLHNLLFCANAAATAAGHLASNDYTPEFYQAYHAERLWQIRRIIDVANTLEKTKKRKNAPKNWPPLGATP